MAQAAFVLSMIFLWPLHAALGHGVAWYWALPSVAACLLWIQIDIDAGPGFAMHRLVAFPALFLAVGLFVAPLTTLYAAAVYATAIGIPLWIARIWHKRRHGAYVEAGQNELRERHERATAAVEQRNREACRNLADEMEAAGRWTEALQALRQLQTYQWNDPALRARIERVRRLAEQTEPGAR